MAEASEAGQALQPAKERKSNQIVGDMDFCVERLAGICNQLREFNDGIFGSGPASALEDAQKADNCFLARREERHNSIVRLLDEVQNEVNRLKDF